MIVSNTTPISNFLHVNRIDILQNLFQHIHIPCYVKDELDEFFSGDTHWQQALQQNIFVIHDVRSSLLLYQSFHGLHQGEIETLCLYLEQQASLCLLDDRDARAVAVLNNIHVSGTLAVLMKAKERGLIEAVKPVMDILRTRHYFWISDSVYQHVLRLSSEIGTR